MNEERKEFVKKEVARLLEYLMEDGDMTICIFTDHHVSSSEEIHWMREQVFSYLCEKLDGTFIVDDSCHMQYLCNGETGKDTIIAKVDILPES